MRPKRKVPEMTVFDVLAQDHLVPDRAKEVSKWMYQGRFDDAGIPVTNILRSMGCEE